MQTVPNRMFVRDRNPYRLFHLGKTLFFFFNQCNVLGLGFPGEKNKCLHMLRFLRRYKIIGRIYVKGFGIKFNSKL